MTRIIRRLITLMFTLFVFTAVIEAQPSQNGFFSKFRKNKKEIVKSSRNPRNSKKQQDAKQRKLKRDYERFVKDSRKHSIDIQSPEVQARMKENQKNSEAKYRAKKKKTAANTRKAGRKYR